MKKTLLIAMALCVFQTQGAENRNPSEQALSKRKRVCSFDVSERAKEISDAYNLNMRATGTNPFKTLSRIFHLDENARQEVFKDCAEIGMSVEESIYRLVRFGAITIIGIPHYSQNPTLFRLVEDLDPIVRELEQLCQKRARSSEVDDNDSGEDDL